MAISIYLPEPHPIADANNQFRITRPWLLALQQNATGSFGTVAISGDGSITAGTGGATITLKAGDGITISADPVTNTITISADGGSFLHEFLLMGS